MRRVSELPVWSKKTQESIDKLEKLGDKLQRSFDRCKERCGDCLFLRH
jgi:hypothetical protein